jgi:hypothetical protein
MVRLASALQKTSKGKAELVESDWIQVEGERKKGEGKKVQQFEQIEVVAA